jgi:hypothetical protein
MLHKESYLKENHSVYLSIYIFNKVQLVYIGHATLITLMLVIPFI